ncbi:MAG: hypothetical protein FWB85_08110 [Chitinispirillia bacterium]|nr:hypothetical protein [Chitinispirillia bacterium]MCL2242272.1 hypothetical protein [Chitinispirillia bacterium]
MSFWKKSLAVACATVVMMGTSVVAEQDTAAHSEAVSEEAVAEEEAEEEALAIPQPFVAPVAVQEAEQVVAPPPAPEAKPASKLQVTPYGSVQYRLRENITTRSDDDNSATTMDYSNRLCWRVGLKAVVDEQLSLQFQIGNDWGAAENINWNSNHGPRSRVGTQNLYVHLASARWNPGYMFIEAGVVPLNSNGTLDLLESSLNSSSSKQGYGEAGYNGWSDMNNSMIGIRLGAPILKDDIKLGVELFQSVINNRQQTIPANLADDPAANPASPLFVLTVPVEAGAFKVTPEVTAVLNRNYNSATEKGDHEYIIGLAGSYKVNSDISVSFNGGYGMVSNEESESGAYSDPANAPGGTFTPYNSNGLLVGAGTSIKAGPGTIQIAVNYNTAVNSESSATEDATKSGYLYTDLRYAMKVHKNFSVVPRYRTYTTTYPEASANNSQMVNRFELIFEGSF